MNNLNIKHAIDTTLSGIDCPAEDIARVLHKAKGEPVMKRKISTTLVAAILALLIAATALAVTLSRSTYNEAATGAQEALMETYGLTHETIGLFDKKVTQKDGVWTVKFRPVKYNQEAIGTYTVTVREGEGPVPAWSHDGETDQIGDDLTSPVWGAKQLDMALSIERDFARKEGPGWVENPTPEEAEARDAAREAWELLGIVEVAPREGDVQEDEALALAREAIIAKYGVSEALLAEYAPRIKFEYHPWEEERNYYISFQKEQPSGLWASFSLWLASPSGKVTYCSWSIDEADRILPEGDLADYPKAVEEYVKVGAFALLDAAGKAEAGARITAAGFGDLIDGLDYIAPEAGDLSEADARTAVEAAMLARYGVEPRMLVLFEDTFALVRDGGTRCWLMTYEPERQVYWGQDFPEKLGIYQVWINATDGSTHRTKWTYDDLALTKDYTASTWAQAPIWGREVLPWVMDFHEAQVAIEDKYKDTLNTHRSLEDAAARDQLYRDAGFVPAGGYYRNGLPGEGDISEAEAIAIARSVMTQDYGVSEAVLDTVLVETSFYVDDPKQNQWEVIFFGFDDGGLGQYNILVAADTGAILDATYVATGNG